MRKCFEMTKLTPRAQTSKQYHLDVHARKDNLGVHARKDNQMNYELNETINVEMKLGNFF